MVGGFFVTLEGPEGSGKTTQARRLEVRLREAGIPVLYTREPGGTVTGDRIRQLLLDPGSSGLDAHAEFLLYAASRAQHLAEKIIPALDRGLTVISDRFMDASLAYQGYGRGLDLAALRSINAFATHGRTPDLTIILMVPVAEGLRRAINTPKEGHVTGVGDRIEQETLAFHQRVADGYRALAAGEPKRFELVDAVRPIDELTEQLVALVRGRRG
ncbi:MAG: dTMP kinase [Verrucomicrobia bacterium GWF2_62_7]|nr:MAG: dTMP kinase [Verrucomicrobia bacterium GWF2_62_7]